MLRVATLFALALTVALSAETLELRGYGQVSATFETDRAELRCDSPAHADVLYAKLYNDLTRIGASAPQADGRELVFADGRRWVLGRDGNSVVLTPAETAGKLAVPERQSYPVYLDYFDLRALKFYKKPMQSFLNLGLENQWDFAKKQGIAGFVLHGMALSRTPAPGITDFTAMDYELGAAAKAGGCVTLCPTIGASLPLWLYNLGPENTAKVQSSTVVSEWQHGVEAGNYESYGPGFDPKHSPILAFQKQVMERYKDHPALGGWQLYRGAPIGDQLGMGMAGVLWDSSPGAAAEFKKFLQGQYSLEELGKRWYHDAKKFASWDQVPFLQLMDIIGGSWDSDRLVLNDRPWQWRVTPKGEFGKFPVSDKPWLTIHWPPSQRCNYLDTGSGYYRLKLDKCDWLAGRTGKTLYLRAAGYGYDSHYLHAFVNGKPFKSPRFHSFAAKLIGIELPPGTLKGDGSDEIILQTPDGRHRGDGRIHGPISLSEHPAENFPYSDSGVNAQIIDQKTFQLERLIARNREMFAYGRKLEPNRPLCISGADKYILRRLAPFFGEQGLAMQSTSIDAFYYPMVADLGRLYGFRFVGEPSAQMAKVEKFDRVFGQQLYLGTAATAIFMDVEQYMRFDKKTGHFSKRAPLLALLGKYEVEMPQVGMLNTTDTFQLGGPAPWNWYLGRGELQSAHVPNLMISEFELENGKANQFKVIVDSSDVMSPKTVAAIKRYVAQGGTFVALPPSGRHTPLERDRQPLAAISGFKVDHRPMSGTIRFMDTCPDFPLWQGQSFNGTGNAKDWKARQCAGGVRLKPRKLDAKVIARWADGSAAIGVRKIDKGKIITLGSGFWRNARDIKGKWLPDSRNPLLEQLAEQLGVTRSVWADSEKLWLRKAVTKNGLEDWIVATNVAEAPIRDVAATISFRLDYEPNQVLDAVTKTAVTFTYADGVVTLKHVAFTPLETRIFAVSRPESPALALKTWWNEKRTYWQRGPAPNFPNVEPLPSVTLNLDSWEMIPDPNGDIAASGDWLNAGFRAKSSFHAGNGTWKILIPELKDYEGDMLYRREFRLPKAWRKRLVTFNFEHSTVYETAEFYLNGKLFMTYDRSKQHPELRSVNSADVSSLLKRRGTNVLAVKVNGGKRLNAGFCGNLWFAVERDLEDAVSLDGTWECVAGDLLTAKPVTVPGKFRGRYLRRTFTAPESWRGKTIFLRLVVPKINLSSVMINEQAKAHNGGFPPFGHRTEINVTELVKPGEVNTIELWHRHTIPTNYVGVQWHWPKDSQISVTDVQIGVAEE
jgi:hypothetical protein